MARDLTKTDDNNFYENKNKNKKTKKKKKTERNKKKEQQQTKTNSVSSQKLITKSRYRRWLQTSPNMPATRSNIVEPTNVI